MNTNLQKQVSLIQSHHNHLFTQPLPRQLREAGWHNISPSDFETDYSPMKQLLTALILSAAFVTMLVLVACQLQPV